VSNGVARTVPAEPAPFVPLLPYQLADVESDARFRWCCWARQTGKSFTKSLRRILRGLTRHRNQVFLSAGERQSRELMTKARQHCHTLGIAHAFMDSEYFAGTRFKRLEITLPGGIRVIGLPANPQTARGFTGDVLLDEFAMHRDDREIWAAMFPTLLRGGGELDVASTPKGPDNLFARLRDNPRFEHSTVTLQDAIAAGLDADVDELRLSMGDDDLFRQEFLCEFLDESAAFLTYAQIAACEDPALIVRGVADLARVVADVFVGVDVGRHRDLTVIWAIMSDGGGWATRAITELKNEPFRAQQSVLSDLLSLSHVRHVCIDAGGLGMQLAETLVENFGRQKVEPVQFTLEAKSAMATRLRIAVEERRFRIPVDSAIRNDWHSVERTMTPDGHMRLTAARTGAGHADRFWAAALALRAADVGRAGPMEARACGPLSFFREGAW